MEHHLAHAINRVNSAAKNRAPKSSGPKRLLLSELSGAAVNRIVALREAGYPLRKIAADFNLSHGSIRVVLQKNGAGSLKPAKMPRRPRNGQAALPDFQRLAKLTAKGKTVKEVWLEYAKMTPKAYCYTHFSTMFRRWLEEQKHQASNTQGVIPDYTADEDEAAEGYWKVRIDPRSSIHSLHGHACALKVERGELVSFENGEMRRFKKVTHGLKAVLFLGQSGNITLDAIKWCEAQGIAICILDWYGDLLSVTQPALKTNVAIRRAQFAADRIKVARAILIQKLASQARFGKLSKPVYRSTLSEIKKAATVEELVTIEGRAALDYWAHWRFELKHKTRNWPDQWTHFHYRASPISGGPRHAMHPANAILNYAYSVAAAQVTRALQVSGFDSAAGFLHADAEGRHSLTYDVLELLRADIDQAILPWVASHVWKRPDFPVTPEGIVRLQPTLAAVVAQRAMKSEKVIDQAVEWLREMLISGRPILLGAVAAAS